MMTRRRVWRGPAALAKDLAGPSTNRDHAHPLLTGEHSGRWQALNSIEITSGVLMPNSSCRPWRAAHEAVDAMGVGDLV